jgi:hypothetical protein
MAAGKAREVAKKEQGGEQLAEKNTGAANPRGFDH